MKRFKSAFFLLLCFALGIGLALAFEHLRRPSKTEETATAIGNGNAPPLRGFSLAGLANPAIVDGFRALHATAVTVVYSGDDAALGRFVYHAHKMNLKVVLLPPGKLSGENPFPAPLAKVAAEAARAGVDALCVSWFNSDPDEAYWQAQLAQVRQAYTGQLILAAAPELLPGIEFWDKVDLIGAIGPFDLPLRGGRNAHTVGIGDLRTAWACYIDSLESLAFRYGKQLVLLNVTVPTPPVAMPANFQELMDEAVVTETKGRLGTQGIFLPWDGNPGTEPAMFVNQSATLQAEISRLWTPSTAPASTTAASDPAEVDFEEPDTAP